MILPYIAHIYPMKGFLEKKKFFFFFQEVLTFFLLDHFQSLLF